MGGPGGPMPGNKSGPGGGGGQGGPKSRGRYFGGGFTQRWTSSSSQQLHYCEVCKISCASKYRFSSGFLRVAQLTLLNIPLRSSNLQRSFRWAETQEKGSCCPHWSTNGIELEIPLKIS